MTPPPPQKIWALISLDQSGASGAKKKWLKKNIVEVGLGPPESSQSIFGIKIFPAPLWSKLIKTQIFWGEEGSKKKVLAYSGDLVQMNCVIFGA